MVTARAQQARRTGIVLVATALGLVALLAFAVHQAVTTGPARPAVLEHPSEAGDLARLATTASRRSSDSLSKPGLALLPPLTGFVSRDFNPEIDHWGVDLAVPEGTAVVAPADGIVVMADETLSGGRTLVLQHARGLTTVFKHNTRLLVRAGERVRAGAVVALSGNTGEWTDGPHLHYEVWQDGEAVDPKPFLAPW